MAKVKPQAYNQDNLCTFHNHDFITDPAFVRAHRRGVQAGDFVECGVNRGFLVCAFIEHRYWDGRGKIVYLVDTFPGIDEPFITAEERAGGILERNRSEFYTTNLDTVRRNFAQWKNVRIIAGAIPETLAAVTSDRIAYLHLDMNCAPPEVAAFEHFWHRLVPGAFVLLDDYAYKGFESQKVAMDGAAKAVDVQILSLPTGQGLIVKPC